MIRTIMERIDAHTHLAPEKRVEAPPFPDAIKIEITSRCNFKCAFCASKRHLRPQGDIDAAFLFRLLHEAKEAGVREIGMFLLGESLLVRQLPEYVRYAKEQAGIEYVFLTTNGSLASPEVMEALIEAGLDSVKFSVNAGTAERYREMHGVNAFDRVVANIRALAATRREKGWRGVRISASSIHDPERVEETETLRKLLGNDIDDFYFLPLYSQAGHVLGAESRGVIGNPGRYEKMVPPVPCWALFNAAKITWNGWLTACCFDHDRRFEIADLGTTTLLDAWRRPRFRALRRAHLDGDEAILRESPCARCLGLAPASA
jgi:MoaA/NifB/PqqE/SkfB family radical SAM enzyme